MSATTLKPSPRPALPSRAGITPGAGTAGHEHGSRGEDVAVQSAPGAPEGGGELQHPAGPARVELTEHQKQYDVGAVVSFLHKTMLPSDAVPIHEVLGLPPEESVTTNVELPVFLALLASMKASSMSLRFKSRNHMSNSAESFHGNRLHFGRLYNEYRSERKHVFSTAKAIAACLRGACGDHAAFNFVYISALLNEWYEEYPCIRPHLPKEVVYVSDKDIGLTAGSPGEPHAAVMLDGQIVMDTWVPVFLPHRTVDSGLRVDKEQLCYRVHQDRDFMRPGDRRELEQLMGSRVPEEPPGDWSDDSHWRRHPDAPDYRNWLVMSLHKPSAANQVYRSGSLEIDPRQQSRDGWRERQKELKMGAVARIAGNRKIIPESPPGFIPSNEEIASLSQKE